MSLVFKLEPKYANYWKDATYIEMCNLASQGPAEEYLNQLRRAAWTINNILNEWTTKNLTLIEKICIVKTLAISKLVIIRPFSKDDRTEKILIDSNISKSSFAEMTLASNLSRRIRILYTTPNNNTSCDVDKGSLSQCTLY